MAHDFLKDQSGISVVIAAVMMLGLLVSIIGIITTSYVPEWKKTAEMEHTQSSSNLMGQVKTYLESLADGSVQNPQWGASKSVVFSLGGGELPIFESRPSTGMLYIEPTTDSMSVYYNSTYTPAVLNETLNQNNINRTILFKGINSFNFTIFDMGPNSTISITLTITYDGDLPRYMRFWKDGLDLVYQVDRLTENFGPTDMRVSRYFENNQTPIDIINYFPGLLFRTGNTIVTTSLSSGGTTTSIWNVSAVRLTDSPTAHEVNCGGGQIGYYIDNLYYVDQHFIISNGGLVLVQGNQSVMYLPPAVTIQAVDPTVVRLRVLAFNLSGYSDVISGSGDAQVQMSVKPDFPANVFVPSGYANANNISLIVNTEYPSAWQTYLTEQADSSGLNATLGHYSITTTSNSVTLLINGKYTDETQDIELEVVESYIYTTIGGFS